MQKSFFSWYIVSSKAEADRLAVGLGVWGKPGDIVEVQTVRITTATLGMVLCDLKSLREPVAEDRAKLAARARAKLTDDEAFALGIGSK